MGLMDEAKDKAEDLKDKAQDLVSEHGDKVGDALEKVGDFIDEKTGKDVAGKVVDKAQEGIEKLGGGDKS
ncbi:MAG: antitoxin [Acidimicrobiales bacterium]